MHPSDETARRAHTRRAHARAQTRAETASAARILIVAAAAPFGYLAALTVAAATPTLRPHAAELATAAAALVLLAAAGAGLSRRGR